MQWLAAVHAGATWFMTGLVWFVQLVHYPLLARVSAGSYAEYHLLHTRLTTSLVVPVMAVEGATAALLLALRPQLVPPLWLWGGLLLSILIWISTGLVLVPAHRLMCRAFDPSVHRRLVRSNWLRTAAWTLRGLLSFGILLRLAG